MLPETRGCPPGRGVRQSFGALETTVNSTVARAHSRALWIARQKAVEDNRSPRRCRALLRPGKCASPLALWERPR